jgi:predicted transcriptional regulator
MSPKKPHSIEACLAEYRKSGKTPSQTAALESILTARTKAGLTQAQVAAMMGTSQAGVARLESNLARGKFPTVPTLEKYAEALGKRVEVRFV